MFKKIAKNIFLVLSGFLIIFGYLVKGFTSETPEEVIQRSDISFYRPLAFGLKDLIVDIRISELVKQLNDKLIFGKLDDVYFRFYWINTGKTDVEIFGLPSGFSEIKTELISLIQNRIDYIIPKMLAHELKGYKLSITEKKADSTIVQANDPDHIKYIYEIKLEFDGENKLRKMVTVGPNGTEQAEFITTKKSWGHNKWILDEINITKNQGIQSTVVTNKLSYEKFSGIGLPILIETNTKQTLLQPYGKKNELYKREVLSNLTFSNYKINTGEAKLFFQKKQ